MQFLQNSAFSFDNESFAYYLISICKSYYFQVRILKVNIPFLMQILRNFALTLTKEYLELILAMQIYFSSANRAFFRAIGTLYRREIHKRCNELRTLAQWTPSINTYTRVYGRFYI